MTHKTNIKSQNTIWRKWWFWTIGGILFFIVLISILGGQTKPTEDKQVGSVYPQYSSPSTTIVLPTTTTTTIPSSTTTTTIPSTTTTVPLSPDNCINYTGAGKHVGEYACVIGKVNNVYTSSKGNNFLNFCANYKTCPFSAVIFNSDSYKFSDIQSYNKKVVEISGLVKTYKGRAEIIINDPSQIKIK